MKRIIHFAIAVSLLGLVACKSKAVREPLVTGNADSLRTALESSGEKKGGAENAASASSSSTEIVSGEYTVEEVKNGGTLAGKVTFKGNPTVEDFVVVKDADKCGVKGGRLKSDRIIVGPGGGLANTWISIVNITKGKALEKKDVLLDQKGCFYTPHIQLVAVGAKAKLRNSDPILHNVHAYTDEGKSNNLFNEAMPLKDQEIVKEITQAGVFPMVCDAGHTWMNAYFIAVNHPYNALTDNNGNFEIKDIPPGKYKVRAWHEGYKIANKEKKDNGDYSYTFEPPYVVEKEVEIKPGAKTELNFEIIGR
ncbi:MAG: carboxypeptidase regulatory-like domain-containing protein [Bacteroidia bacterium]|nr:carboxypeptidase regulatory-like domain-containing protein [Bacteroidia bacterium]